jgi:hypothetical protein
MTKTHHFDSLFAQQEAKKLSIIGDRKLTKDSTPTRSLERVCYLLDTRCSSLGLSKSSVLFERDNRKVSSLTNGIDPTHCSDTDTSQIQESMPRRPEVSVFTHTSMSALSILDTSGEQPTMAERRWD